MKTPSFEVEEGGCRQRPPSILWFGGSCSSVRVVVLTTSNTNTLSTFPGIVLVGRIHEKQ